MPGALPKSRSRIVRESGDSVEMQLARMAGKVSRGATRQHGDAVEVEISAMAGEGRRRLWPHQGDAVEMEDAAVALVCHLNKIPWLLIRTISDRADGSAVDDFSQFLRSVTAHEVALLRAVLSDPTI